MGHRDALTIAAVALIASAAILSGCGASGASDSASQPSATAEATTTTTVAPITQEQLNAALLQVSDLPAGYSAVASADSTSPGSSTAGDFCKEANNALRNSPNDGGPAARNIGFQKSRFGPILVEQLFVNADAGKLFGIARDALNVCATANTVTDPNGDLAEYTLAPVSFPSHGDEQVAYRITSTSGELQLEGTVVLVRIDNVIALIAGVGTTSIFGNFPLGIDEFSDVVDTAVGKIKAG